MSTPKDDGEKLHAFKDAVAENVAATGEAELVEEATAEGADVRQEAERLRGVLLNTVMEFKKARLAAAEKQHQRSVEAFRSSEHALPSSPEARRKLLERSLKRRPEMREAMVTLQHRNFESLDDADVQGALKQLSHLGALADDADDSGDE